MRLLLLRRINETYVYCIPSRHKARRYKDRGSPKFPSLCKAFVPPSKVLRARKCRIASRTTQYLVKHSTNNLNIKAQQHISKEKKSKNERSMIQCNTRRWLNSRLSLPQATLKKRQSRGKRTIKKLQCWQPKLNI